VRRDRAGGNTERTVARTGGAGYGATVVNTDSRLIGEWGERRERRVLPYAGVVAKGRKRSCARAARARLGLGPVRWDRYFMGFSHGLHHAVTMGAQGGLEI
jgi:hypothetical protein